MPFQGNVNAGAIDPSIIQTLYQAKRDRQELAIAQQKAQMEAELAAKKEAREQRKSDLDVLIKRADLASKMKAMSEGVDSARRNTEQTTSRNFTEDDLMGGGGGMDFANIVAQNDPTAGAQVGESNAAQANLASILSAYSEVQNELNPNIDPIDAAFGAGQSVETDRSRTAQLDLEKTLAAEGRQKTKEDLAREDEQAHARSQTRLSDSLATTRGVRTIQERERELQKLSNKIASPKITGQDRELAESQYRAIKAEADADLTAGQPPEVITERRRRADENFKYDQVYDQGRFVSEMISKIESGDTSSVGVQGWASEVISNFKDIVETTSSIPFVDRYAATMNAVLDNPANTPEERQIILDKYFSQDVMDRVASGRLTEQEMQWWFMYSLNPDGRVSNLLAKDTQNRTRVIGPTVGPKQSLSRLRAIATRQGQFLRRERNKIQTIDKSEAFDPDGRRVASEALPMPKTGTVPAPVARPMVQPKETPEQRAARIRAGAN